MKISIVINWIISFSKNTNTNWIVDRKNSNPQRYLYPKLFKCQHSSKTKSNNSNEAIKNRDFKCNANINILVKKIMKNTIKNDELLKKGHNTEIKVRFIQNKLYLIL